MTNTCNHVPFKLFLISLLFGITPLNATAQEDKLNLRDIGLKIDNTIELTMSKKEYGKIVATTGRKETLKNVTVLVNGDSLAVEDIHTRGNTTLFLRRKSFSFSLGSKAQFSHGERSLKAKKFNAISLSMDKNYKRNRVAFELMEDLKLFGLFYTYCEVKVNGQSEGIYMIIERPQDWAMKKKDSPLVIRRGYNNKIDKLKTGKEVDKDLEKEYKNYYSMIYKSLNKHSGEELYNVLSQWIDLEMYMSWLAFNYFVRNGDYTDEVYFCISPKENRFKIIPWDYDDIFATEPHEGKDAMKTMLGNKLIFSTEDLLDQRIAKDQFLYGKYLEQLEHVLSEISEASIKRVFENTYAELYPYYSNPEIIGMNRFDAYKSAGLETLNKDLSKLYEQLTTSRKTLLTVLNL